MNEPELRFKADDGSDYPDWNHVVVHDLFALIKDVNKSGENKNVITNSAEYGLIPQRDYFDKDIAVEGNTNKYTVIKQGDFVYNPRKSQSAPYGPFNCYTKTQEGIVSPLYFGLRPKHSEMSPYLKYYFASHAWHQYIYNNGAQDGARHDRVGMTNELLLNIPVSVPCLEEQQKIADLFFTLNNVIDSVQKEVDSWEQIKRGVMQKLFSQEVRFKADDGSDFPDWTTIKADDLLENIIDRNHPEDTVLTIIQGEGTVPRKDAGRNIQYDKKYLSTYKQVKKNDFIIHLRSFEGGLEIVNETGIVSPAYIILRSKKEIAPGFYNAYFHSNEFIHHNLPKTVEGIRDGRQISYSAFKQLYLPWCCLEEQQKIADCLSEFDLVIEKTKQKLEAYKQLKKGLMQRMFV